MDVIRFEKNLNTLPGTLTPNTLYAVKKGDSFDLYITDSTGAVAYKNRANTWGGSRWCYNDFHNIDGTVHALPFTFTPISGGTYNGTIAVATPETAGLVLLTKANTANTGVRIQTSQPIISGTGLTFRGVLSKTSISGTLLRLGFSDTLTETDATDGMYFEINNMDVSVKTANSGTRTTAPTIFTMASDTFYVFDITQLTASTVRFVVTNAATKTVALDQTITSNVPTADIARAFLAGLVGVGTSAGVSNLCYLDYMGFGPAKPSFIDIPFVG